MTSLFDSEELNCILADRLYVPEAYVTPEHLNEYVYDIETTCAYDFGPFQTVTGSIRTFSKVQIDGKLYYGFSRGDIEKLSRLFGDFNWINRTSAPRMTSPLKFKGQLHTWSSKKIGQQEAVDAWLKHRSGIIRAAPRFGKTISSIFLMTKLGYKTLIVAHQIDLLEQFYKSFQAFTNVDEIITADPQQKKRDARGRVFGFFHDYDNPEELDVCLLCWQTLASKAHGAERMRMYANAWGTVIVDECHPYSTPVLIDYDKYMSIGEVYENPSITHVLSYNLETKSIEKKKILARRCHESEKSRVTIRVSGERGVACISPTENHKYYVVGKGYVEAKDLCRGDQLITYDGNIFKTTICPECEEVFVAPTLNPASVSGQLTHHHAKVHGAETFTTLRQCPHCSYTGYSLTTHMLKEHDTDKFNLRNERTAAGRKAFLWSEQGKSHREFYSQRMLTNNPSFDEGTRNKIGEAVSATFWSKTDEEQNEQVRRFQNAPKKVASPTVKEREIIDQKISNLVFTGNGFYYVSLLLEGKKRKKNPDFVCVPEQSMADWLAGKFKPTKVVEIMDYEYWHSQDEIEPLRAAYLEVGIDCLVLNADVSIEDMRSLIEAFINNHYVTVESVTKVINPRKDKRVYNLEVEDNHNYFVVANRVSEAGRIAKTPTTPILVSNCHKVGGICYARTVNRLNARHRLGLTGTVERTDGREFLLKDIIGPVVAEGRVATISCKVAITHTAIPIKYSFTEPFSYLYKRIFKAKGRMDIIMKDLQKDVDDGKYICFAFHRCSVEQLREWTKTLQLLGIKAESFYGTCKDREGVLQRARSGETQVLVCNSQMLTGIDIPRWNVYYSAFPTSNVVFNENGDLSGNFYQEFSRIRTPFVYEDGSEKTIGIIRDYVDNNSMCFASYKKRYRAYQNQGFSIAITKLAPPPAETNLE